MTKVQALGAVLVFVFTYVPMLSVKMDERKKKQKADEEAA